MPQFIPEFISQFIPHVVSTFPLKLSPKRSSPKRSIGGFKLPLLPLLIWVGFGVGVSSCDNTAWGQRIEQALSIPTPVPASDETPSPQAIGSPVIGSPLPEVQPTSTAKGDGTPESSGELESNTNTEEPQSLSPNLSPNPSPNPSLFSPSPQPSGNLSGDSSENLTNLPAPLNRAIQSVLALQVISVPTTPARIWEQPITHRQFARWLFELNNRLYADRPGQQIRASSANATPAFQDILPSDPDFTLIQGLAEAGILPSPLRGNATTTQFRPDAPLTREKMVLWKVPLDARRAIPTATIDRIEQTWNFQDSQQISGEALGAVLLDFQNGELSNIRRVFGYTTLFQPQKSVTQAEAIAALDYFGFQGQGVSASNPPALASNAAEQ